jgi:hypothetical protein
MRNLKSFNDFTDIHRDFIIADQWTEPHSPCQKPDELNGVKNLSHMLKYFWIGQAQQIVYGF